MSPEKSPVNWQVLWSKQIGRYNVLFEFVLGILNFRGS